MVRRKGFVRSVRSVCYKINYPWGEITDPLYLPLKRGGLVCPPLESPYDILWSGWKICVYLCNLWEIKIIIRVGDKIIIRGER